MSRLTCRCGRDLGERSLASVGLCPDCDASIWMQVARAFVPDAVTICAILNGQDAPVCPHNNCPCFSRCSVTRAPSGRWVPIGERQRQAWFDRVIGPKRDPFEGYVRRPAAAAQLSGEAQAIENSRWYRRAVPPAGIEAEIDAIYESAAEFSVRASACRGCGCSARFCADTSPPGMTCCPDCTHRGTNG